MKRLRWLMLAGVIGSWYCAGCAANGPPPPGSSVSPGEEGLIYTYAFSMTSPVQQSALEYRDDTLLCRLTPRELEIGLDLINLSEKPLTVDWDQVRFIDPDGVSHPVLHSLVLLPDANRRQTPSLVIPQGVLNDRVAPKDYVFRDATGWHQRPIFPKTKAALRIKDATFGVALPIKIEGAVKMYTFAFQIQRIQRVFLKK